MVLLKHVLFVSLLWMGSPAIAQQKNAPPPADAGQKKEAVRDTRPKDFVVNPKLCKRGDKKYIYWATEQKVFRFRYDPEAPIVISLADQWPSTERAAKSIPPAPDPTEALGCYLNPIRAGNPPYLYERSKVIYLKVFGRKNPVLGPGVHRFVSDPGRWHDVTGGRVDRFQKAQVCRERSKSVSECLIGAKGRLDDPDENRIAQIKKESVSTVLKEDLYVSVANDAAAMVRADNGLHAESGFYIFDSIRIDISFRIFLGEVDKLEDYFRALISELESAKVENYRWAKQ